MSKSILVVIFIASTLALLFPQEKLSAAKAFLEKKEKPRIEAALACLAGLDVHEDSQFLYDEKDFLNIGKEMKSFGYVEEAARYFEKVTELIPQSSMIWENLATIHVRILHKEEAVRCFQQAIKINPKNGSAQEQLKMIDVLLEDTRYETREKMGFGPGENTGLQGPYLGQWLPGLKPGLFAPGIVSMFGSNENTVTIYPEGWELYFGKESGIRVWRWRETCWTAHQNTGWPGYEMWISPESGKMHYTGYEPGIWVMQRFGSTWQTPAPQVALPETPVGRCAVAYFKAFNTGDAAMRRFIQEFRSAAYIADNPVEDQIRFYRTVRQSSGDLTIERFTAVSDFEIIVIASMALRPGALVTVRFRVQSTAPHVLDVLTLTRGAADERLDSVVIDAATLDRTIDALAALLRKAYVSPEMGDELASLLVANRRSGRYAGITNGVSLAARFTADLFARAQDGHLSVHFGRLPGSRGARLEQADAAISDGVREVRLLDGNIGYIRLNGFEPRDQAQADIAKAMAVVKPASALVFDLRDNQGGDPETVGLVAGYLLEKRTLLGSRHSRLHEGVREFYSEDISRSARFGTDKPVYVLTSRRTVSAAEAFALALQELKRATVVGEKTGGSGHVAMDMEVTNLFWVRMPYGRMLSPVSKRNWERTGILPDIQVPEDAALNAAVRDARKRLASKGATVQTLRQKTRNTQTHIIFK